MEEQRHIFMPITEDHVFHDDPRIGRCAFSLCGRERSHWTHDVTPKMLHDALVRGETLDADGNLAEAKMAVWEYVALLEQHAENLRYKNDVLQSERCGFRFHLAHFCRCIAERISYERHLLTDEIDAYLVTSSRTRLALAHTLQRCAHIILHGPFAPFPTDETDPIPF